MTVVTPRPTPDAEVTLCELTPENHQSFLKLKVGPDQENLVANNWVSIAQAHFSDEAWYRGIRAGDTPVGFVMCAHRDGETDWYLWRYMIDANHQRHGHGRRALELVIAHARTVPGVEAVKLSFVEVEGSPEPFYAKLGFTRTGEIDEGEHVMRLVL